MSRLDDRLGDARRAHRDGRLDDAEAAYLGILREAPAFAPALHLLGVLRLQQGRLPESEALLRQATTIEPTPRARLHLGLCLHRLGRGADAFALLSNLAAGTPDDADIQYNFGVVCLETGHLDEAIPALRRAAALAPNDVQAPSNLGLALRMAGRSQAALEILRPLAHAAPTFEPATINLVEALLDGDDVEEARAALDRLLEAREDDARLLLLRLRTALRGGELEAAEDLQRRASRALQRGVEGTDDWRLLASALYLDVLRPWPDGLSAALRRRLDTLLRVPGATPPGDYRHGRLRIGYLSPHFGDHPVGHVLHRLFEAHDRGAVEVHAFSLRDRSGDPGGYHAAIRRGCDRFHDVAGLAGARLAERIRTEEIDVLVDLDGFMGYGGIQAMAHRAAPVQAFWLGHAGGLGLSFVDWVIADRIVAPAPEGTRAGDAVAWIPAPYHPASPHAIAGSCPSRRDSGLPEAGLVFCAFNNPEKIDRAVFSCWCAILAAVPGSALWLTAPPRASEAKARLRALARSDGLDPDRLVFAERIADKAVHLARHRHADLFLDTITLNASTTALDALWAGVPLLTVAGDRFAGRIAETFLRSLGLDELVAPDLASYREKAIALAADAPRLRAPGERLRTARTTSAVFDVATTARRLEAAYREMHRRCRQGDPPRSFAPGAA